MGVIGGDHRQAAPLGQQQIGNGKAVGPVAAHGAAVVIDLDRMGGGQAAGIVQCQARPLRMGNRDKGPRRHCPRRQRGAAFHAGMHGEIRSGGRRKVGRQADRQNVPQLSIAHRAGMQLGPRQGGESRRTKGLRIHDRIIVAPDEMVGQRQKVIALGAVAAADLLGRQDPVGAGGMAVQIAAPEPARR